MILETLMRSNLDQYFTPINVAQDLVKDNLKERPKVCVDSTCGSGNLLEAVSNVFRRTKCVGIDKDKNIIANLRRKNPNWILSTGDLLDYRSLRKTNAIALKDACDFLFLNPPFSLGNKKSVDIFYTGHNIKGSVAMAYILKSFELFNPKQGAIVLAPESVLYSDTDSLARSLIREKFDINIIAELESNTFQGASARATVLRIQPGSTRKTTNTINIRPRNKLDVQLVRGGLPVHEISISSKGLPYLHSTDIKGVIQNLDSPLKPKLVKKISRGVVKPGWALVIPRVGLPIKDLLKPHYFKGDTQLSDCVICMSTNNKETCDATAKRIRLYWESFLELYRGTGARFVTVKRLSEWLESKNVSTMDRS